MSFSRPSLTDLVTRIGNDIASRLETDDVLRRADAVVNGRVMAGVAHGLYGFLEWLANQVIYDTAESEFLERWASIWGVPREAAASATGSVSFTVMAGATIPSGTLLQALGGVQYETTEDATIVSLTATAPVAAVMAGASGNSDAGQRLTLVSPIDGVQSTATAGELSGGADIETDDALRSRLLIRIRQPPQGGCESDYVTWALEVEGVTRAWCYPAELGPGTVTVRFVRDNDASLIPGVDEVATVQTHIDALRPVAAKLTVVVAPVAVALDFSIQGLVPATSTVQAAVAAELSDLLLREAVPGGTILLSHIRAAISAATDESDYVLVSPIANVTNTTGNISTMGAITWL